jgi:hypothetical protein
MQLSLAAEPSKFLVVLKWYVLLMFCFVCLVVRSLLVAVSDRWLRGKWMRK